MEREDWEREEAGEEEERVFEATCERGMRQEGWRGVVPHFRYSAFLSANKLLLSTSQSKEAGENKQTNTCMIPRCGERRLASPPPLAASVQSLLSFGFSKKYFMFFSRVVTTVVNLSVCNCVLKIIKQAAHPCLCIRKATEHIAREQSLLCSRPPI